MTSPERITTPSVPEPGVPLDDALLIRDPHHVHPFAEATSLDYAGKTICCDCIFRKGHAVHVLRAAPETDHRYELLDD